jgi:hypothetical protein
MKHESPHTRVCNGEAANLLLFPNEPVTPAKASPPTNAPSVLDSALIQNAPLSLAQITAEWQALLKRLGRRRRVLETILTAGRPIRLTDHILVVGFPPHRCFHRELLDTLDYRTCVEEELARTFRVRLAVVTALYPESPSLTRKGALGKAPA